MEGPPSPFAFPLEGKVAAEGGRMRCSRRSGVVFFVG